MALHLLDLCWAVRECSDQWRLLAEGLCVEKTSLEKFPKEIELEGQWTMFEALLEWADVARHLSDLLGVVSRM